MQHHLDKPEKREACFAKLLTFKQRQVLAYLYRDESDRLAIAVQLWVARTDEQLRVAITVDSDVAATMLFNDLDDERITEMLEEMDVESIEGGR